jgi:aspartyl-tRNA(Asn)/glutamyl-tRNA(Gln) amidotransferase subunit A
VRRPIIKLSELPGIARCNAIHTTLWRACCHPLTGGMTNRWAELDPSLQAYAEAGGAVSREAVLGALIEWGKRGLRLP